MKLSLSVIVPSIRPEKLFGLYKSILESYTEPDWEMIVVSPYDLPQEFNTIENVWLIKSWRSPIACQQLGLIQSKGEYFTWMADDGLLMPDALNQSFRLLKGHDYKTLVTGKYFEGDAPVKMDTNWYYILNNHDSIKNLPGVPPYCWMLNIGLISRQLCIELGGWDASRFQACPFAYNDFAIRLKKFRANFIMQDEVMFKCSHLPGCQGDHGPIHVAQTQYDEAIFKGLYSVPNNRIKIDIDNWKESEERWSMRFGG